MYRFIPTVSGGRPSEEHMSEFTCRERDGIRLWVHERIQPADPAKDIVIDKYSLFFLAPWLAVRNAAEIQPF